MKRPLLILALALAIFFCGCADKRLVNKELLENTGCSAFNFTSLLATNPKVKKITDLRKQDQKTWENTLFSVKDYCEMNSWEISSIINAYEIKTNYASKINVVDGEVTIGSSHRNYIALDDSWNFMAVSRDKTIKFFKNNQRIKIDGKEILLEVISDYQDSDRPFVIGLKIYDKREDGEAIASQSVFTPRKNMFVFEDTIITF